MVSHSHSVTRTVVLPCGYHCSCHAMVTADRQRELARERQRRRRARLAEQAPATPDRYCLCCRELFTPKRRDSWLCSRRCIDRVSWHRKQARKAELAALFREIRQAEHGTPNPLALQDLQFRWLDDPRPSEAAYRLWFPDLCDLSPEQALADRERFQQLCREASVG